MVATVLGAYIKFRALCFNDESARRPITIYPLLGAESHRILFPPYIDARSCILAWAPIL